jgi:hypothetical protein
MEMCLQSRYSAKDVVYFLIWQSLPSNGSTFHIIINMTVDYFTKQHEAIALSNKDAVCFLQS